MTKPPMMKLRVARPKYLIDIHRIGDLNYIREEAGQIRIGAMTRHIEIEESPLLAAKLPILREAASEIGDAQVRNRGTIGGGLAEADPSGDYAFEVFRKADAIKAGAQAELEKKALQLTGSANSVPAPAGRPRG